MAGTARDRVHAKTPGRAASHKAGSSRVHRAGGASVYVSSPPRPCGRNSLHSAKGNGLQGAERLEDRGDARGIVAGARTTPDIVYYLARVLADKGQTDNARRLLQSAVGATGAFAHRDDANTLLKSLAH